MSHPPGSVLKPLVKLGPTPGDCWVWLGHVDKEGNSRKEFAGRALIARRWLWKQLFGPIPGGLIVSPQCGNKACTNPHHLVARAQADANRGGVGALLLPADVVEIKRAKKTKTAATANILANRLGCSPQTVRDIWRGKTWRKTKAPNYGPAGGVIAR